MIDVNKYLKDKTSSRIFWDCMQDIIDEIQDLEPRLANGYSKKKMITSMSRLLLKIEKLYEANSDFIRDMKGLIEILKGNERRENLSD